MDKKEKRDVAKKALMKYKETGNETDRDRVAAVIRKAQLNDLQRRVLEKRFVELKTYRIISEEEYREKRWLQRVCNRALERIYDQNLTALL